MGKAGEWVRAFDIQLGKPARHVAQIGRMHRIQREIIASISVCKISFSLAYFLAEKRKSRAPKWKIPFCAAESHDVAPGATIGAADSSEWVEAGKRLCGALAPPAQLVNAPLKLSEHFPRARAG